MADRGWLLHKPADLHALGTLNWAHGVCPPHNRFLKPVGRLVCEKVMRAAQYAWGWEGVMRALGAANGGAASGRGDWAHVYATHVREPLLREAHSWDDSHGEPVIADALRAALQKRSPWAVPQHAVEAGRRSGQLLHVSPCSEVVSRTELAWGCQRCPASETWPMICSIAGGRCCAHGGLSVAPEV